MTVTATAPSNIALLKYWGKRDAVRQWPANDSLSMTLSAAKTETTAAVAAADSVVFEGRALAPESKEAKKIARHLDRLRGATGNGARLAIETRNTFPAGCGIASSASGFAALTAAGCAALVGATDASGLAARGFDLATLAALARQGSGSACRSLAGGYVRWTAGDAADRQAVAQVVAPGMFDLADLIVVLSDKEKAVPSTAAHAFAWSSPLFPPRLAGVAERIARIEAALKGCDFTALGIEIEAEALEMHAVIMTATPPVSYLTAATTAFCTWLREQRQRGGFEAYFTIDAGPNVHVLARLEDAADLAGVIRAAFGAQVKDIVMDRTGLGVSVRAGGFGDSLDSVHHNAGRGRGGADLGRARETSE